MTKSKFGITAKIYDRSFRNIVGGSDASLTLQTLYAGGCEPYPITGLTGVTGQFPGAEGYASPVNVVGTLKNAEFGLFSFEIPAAQTAQMARGDELDFQLRFVDDAGINILILEGALAVRDPLFGV